MIGVPATTQPSTSPGKVRTKSHSPYPRTITFNGPKKAPKKMAKVKLK